jgi:hypothetical protein
MRVSLYAIENGFYLIPTIELMWEGPDRLGVCFVWLNRDLTIWVKHEREEKDSKKSYRHANDPFFAHYEHHPASADYKKDLVRCGTCLEPKVLDFGSSELVCKNPRCHTNLGYSDYDVRR